MALLAIKNKGIKASKGKYIAFIDSDIYGIEKTRVMLTI